MKVVEIIDRFLNLAIGPRLRGGRCVQEALYGSVIEYFVSVCRKSDRDELFENRCRRLVPGGDRVAREEVKHDRHFIGGLSDEVAGATVVRLLLLEGVLLHDINQAPDKGVPKVEHGDVRIVQSVRRVERGPLNRRPDGCDPEARIVESDPERSVIVFGDAATEPAESTPNERLDLLR